MEDGNVVSLKKVSQLAVLLFVCTGCNSTFYSNSPYFVTPEQAKIIEQQRQEAILLYQNEVETCEKPIWNKKTAYEKQTCLNDVEKKNPEPKFNSDIQAALNTENLKGALDFSEGKISLQRFLLTKQENELKADFAQKEIVRRTNEQIQQQQAQRAQLDEMRRIRTANALQQMNQNFQQQQIIRQQNSFQQQQLMMMNRPVSTNCRAFGNNLNCTSW